jgi:hypothetical protein
MAEIKSLVALVYPNGRTAQAMLIGQAELQPGQHFELYGRRWRAVRLTRQRWFATGPQRMICEAVCVRDEDQEPRGSSGHALNPGARRSAG